VQDVYTAALIELDPEKLKMLIEDAERAIAIRYMNLDPVQDADEARRLADARRGLSLLRHELSDALNPIPGAQHTLDR